MAAKTKRRLKSMDDIRKFMADLINRLNNGEVEESRARALIYGCSNLAAIVKDADLEIRLNKLEQAMQQEGASGPA